MLPAKRCHVPEPDGADDSVTAHHERVEPLRARETAAASPPHVADGLSPSAVASRLTVALVIAYAALGAVAYWMVGDRSYWVRLLQPQFFLVLPAGALLSLPVVLMGIRRRVRPMPGEPPIPVLMAWRTAWARLSVERLAFVTAVTVLAALFLNAFIAWKQLIPVLHPFQFDAALARWGFALHGGPPYRLLTWLPIAVIDPLYYYGWTIGLVVGVLGFAWAGDARALLSLVLGWILLGTVTAIVVSSAGPPYYTAVTGAPNPYRGLFIWLSAANGGQPAFALAVQRSLWVVRESGRIVSGTGISAFPSMHVATAMLFTLAARPRWLRGVLAIYTLLILIGSIELGWHYALDGYGAIAGALLVWRLTEPMARLASQR